MSQQRTAAARGKKLPGACHLSCKKAPLYHQKLPQKYCLRNSFESKVSILKISLNEKPFKWGSNVVDIICLLGWFNWSAKKGGGPLMLMALWGCLGRVNWIPPPFYSFNAVAKKAVTATAPLATMTDVQILCSFSLNRKWVSPLRLGASSCAYFVSFNHCQCKAEWMGTKMSK